MSKAKQVVDRRGRTWTLKKVSWKDAEAEDSRFWYEELTPEQRVEAVYDAVESCLKTRGIDTVPRLQKVHRRIKRRPQK